MIREEAINHLKTVAKTAIDSGYDSAVVDAVDMAREALEQEPCEDAISRDELLKAMNTWDKFGYTETGCFVREPKNDCVKYIHYDDVVKCIKGMPPVTPQPKTGHWRRVTDKAGHLVWECDCGWQQRFATNFCPDCGTKMAESEGKE